MSNIIAHICIFVNDVSKDMYEYGIFSDDTIESIKDDYVWNKENDKHKDKGRDDFEL